MLPRCLLPAQLFPELIAETRRVIPLSPVITNGRVTDSRQTEEQAPCTGKISCKTNSKQRSSVNCKKTIYKSFPSCKMLLSNNYLHKQKSSKHMTNFVKGVVLWAEKLIFPNWWLLSNTICHLLSWVSV